MHAGGGLGQGDRVVGAVAAEDDDRLLGFLTLGVGVVRRGRAFEKVLDVRLFVCGGAARANDCLGNIQLGGNGAYDVIVIAQDNVGRYTAVEQGLEYRGGVRSDRVFETKDRSYRTADREVESSVSLQ